MEDNFDVIVVGAGPAGYACAIRAAQLGMRVACVERSATLGGTCLNVGCIPSKALLHASEKFAELRDHGAAMGIVCGDISVDLTKMMRFKEDAITGNTKGVAYLFKKNNIHLVQGLATLKGAGHVHVQNAEGVSILRAPHVVLATGSMPAPLPDIPVDEEHIVTSTGALSLSKVPETMAIIGAGVIGVEMGAVWSRLGAQVTLIEYADRVLANMDKDISAALKKALEKQGWHFVFNTTVESVQVNEIKGKGGKKGGKKKCALTLKDRTTGAKTKLEASVVLVAAGRRPCVRDLELEKTDVALEPKEFITVRPGTYQTTLPGVYAIGDVIGGAMLAHKAMEEGVVLAEYLSHQRSCQVNYNAIPSVVYTAPEIASVGLTEEEARNQASEKGHSVRVGMFPLTANGRAKAIGATAGFVKIVVCAETDRILGGHIMAPFASEMIHELAAIIEFGGSSEDVARMCHAHPTFSEAIKEAALAVFDKPLHM